MPPMLAQDANLTTVLCISMQVLRHALSRPQAFYATMEVILQDNRAKRMDTFTYSQLSAPMGMGCGYIKAGHMLASQSMQSTAHAARVSRVQGHNCPSATSSLTALASCSLPRLQHFE